MSYCSNYNTKEQREQAYHLNKIKDKIRGKIKSIRFHDDYILKHKNDIVELQLKQNILIKKLGSAYKDKYERYKKRDK